MVDGCQVLKILFLLFPSIPNFMGDAISVLKESLAQYMRKFATNFYVDNPLVSNRLLPSNLITSRPK